jgi:hypothetical protein
MQFASESGELNVPKQKLPNRRQGFTLQFQTPARLGKSPSSYTATLNYDEHNTLKEVFLSSGKVGGDIGILLYELSVFISYCLRHGAKIEEIKGALPRADDGSAEGPAGTLLDRLAEEMAKDAEKELLS